MPARPPKPRGGTYEIAVGEAIRDRRKQLGMSQRDVARELGDVTEGMVGFWERGDARVSAAVFMRLAVQAFGMRPTDLMALVELKLIDEADDNYWLPD